MTDRSRRPSWRMPAFRAGLLAAFIGIGAAHAPAQEIRVLSSRPDMVTDARLLARYFRNAGADPFTSARQRAVAGFLVLETMHNVSHKAGRISVGEFCPDALPDELS